jgi:hypothetical protein
MTPVQTLYKWFNDNPEATYKEALEAYEHCLELEKNEREKLVDDALTNYELGWADRKKQFSLYEHKETITSSDTPVSNTFLESVTQQEKSEKPIYFEISDEEIEKAFTIETEVQTTKYVGEIAGAKWYREQLKQR